MTIKHDQNKVSIIGAGFVGSTIAYSLLHQNVAETVALIDVNDKLVSSQIMDLQHSLPILGNAEVKVGNYDDLKDSAVAVIACGVSQKPGDTRLDLVEKNSAIIKEIVPKIFKANPDIVIVMVTNPVDVLTYLAINMFPNKKHQIMGSGTILDTMRFRFLLGKELKIDPRSVHAYIVGEHGDSELPLWSTAMIGNQSLLSFKELTVSKKNKIFNEAKNAAYAIIAGKQSTYYGIGVGAAHLVNAILLNKKTVLPVSHLMAGEYGLKDVCLSMPAVVGEKGIVQKLKLKINSQEQKLLRSSADQLKKIYRSLK